MSDDKARFGMIASINRNSVGNINLDNLDDFLADGQIEPIHPGILYKDLVVRRERLKISDVAYTAGISREMLHRILRGEASITTRTAIGLGKVAGNDPSFWLRAQQIYDLWREREKRKITEKMLEVSYSYQMQGHDTLYNADVDFYRSIPAFKEEYREPHKDTFGRVSWKPAVPAPDVLAALIASGTAILSSTGLATAIKAYLRSRRTKISLKDLGSEIEVAYEGPNLKESISDIEAALETMSKHIDIRAEKLQRAHAKSPTAKEHDT